MTTSSGRGAQRRRSWLYAAIAVDVLLVIVLAGGVLFADLHPVAKVIIALGGIGAFYAAVQRVRALRAPSSD